MTRRIKVYFLISSAKILSNVLAVFCRDALFAARVSLCQSKVSCVCRSPGMPLVIKERLQLKPDLLILNTNLLVICLLL